MELHRSKTQVLLGIFYVLQSQTAMYCETSEKRNHTQISTQHKRNVQFLGFFAPVHLHSANIRPVASDALSTERARLFCATGCFHYGDSGLPCIHTATLPLLFPLDCAAACHLVQMCQGPTTADIRVAPCPKRTRCKTYSSGNNYALLFLPTYKCVHVVVMHSGFPQTYYLYLPTHFSSQTAEFWLFIQIQRIIRCYVVYSFFPSDQF